MRNQTASDDLTSRFLHHLVRMALDMSWSPSWMLYARSSGVRASDNRIGRSSESRPGLEPRRRSLGYRSLIAWKGVRVPDSWRVYQPAVVPPNLPGVDDRREGSTPWRRGRACWRHTLR